MSNLITPIVDWLDGVFRDIPMVFLEVWGRFSFFLGIALIALVFGRFTFRCGNRWALGRERQTWDTKAILSMSLTIVLVIGFGALGSRIVIVPGAQTLESLKDAMVFVCVVLFGYPAIIGAPIAYVMSDIIEGVSPDLLWRWGIAFPAIPVFHWIAYQFFGKDPDFRKLRVWGWYGLFVLFFMAFYAPLWGYACGPLSGVFPAEISYRVIVPAVLITFMFTWLIVPVVILGALPLARKCGMFWAEIPGHVRERRLGSGEWAWKSGVGDFKPDAGNAPQGIPIRIMVALPFIALVLLMVGVVAFSSSRSGEASGNRLAERLHQAIAEKIQMQVDDAMAAPNLDPAARAAALSKLLGEVGIARDGRAFILDRDGRLVASSSGTATGAAGPEDAIVANALSGLRQQFGAPAAVKEAKAFRFDVVTANPLSRETWLGRITPYRCKDDTLGWQVVTAVPESDFLGEIRNANSKAAIILTVALVLSLLVAVFLAEFMASPLRRLAHSADVLAQGDLAQRVRPSHLTEVNALASAFNRMGSQLQTSFERTRAGEEALRKSSERLLLATQSAGIGIWDWDVVKNELVWDDAMYRLYGIRREDFTDAYAAWAQLLHPEDKFKVEAAIQAALDGEREYSEEIRIIRPDGSVRVLQARSQTFHDASGKPLRMVGVNYDITERKLIHEELRRHRDNMEELVATRTAELSEANTSLEKTVKELGLSRYMLDKASTAIYLIDRDGRFIYVNECAAHYAGYTRAEMLRLKVDDLNPAYTPESWGKRWDSVHALPEGELDVTRMLHRRKDGSSYPIELLAHHISHEGKDYQLSVGIDISERERTQEDLMKVNARSDQALALTRAGYWSIVLGDTHYVASPRCAEILGEEPSPDWRYSIASWVANMEAADPVRAAASVESYRMVSEGETPNYDTLFPTKRKVDGRIVWVHSLGKVVSTPGRPPEMYGVIQDVTEIVENRKELEEARRAAETANRLKSEFLANMSHEIRTPMNAILGYAQLMQQDSSLASTHLGQVKTINRAGEHLLAIINDVLDMSKIEAGLVKRNESAFDLHVVLADLVELHAERARAKGLMLSAERAPDLPRDIVSDQGKLCQILGNIIGNAVKFTTEGTIHMVSSVARTVGEEADLRFAITDTGPGISSEELQKLFRPFVQSAAGVRAGGTGLGLSISREYARLLDGDITVESELGRGSTFTLTIRARIADSARIVARLEKPAVLRLAEGSPPIRILIVDDEPLNRQLLADMLSPIGFEVRMAEDGRSAMDAFAQWKPHAIVMDMRMPVMDGIEAARRIKAMEDGATTLIIALSASAFEEEQAAFVESGADLFMTKPFRQGELLDYIGERLGVEYVYASAAAKPEPSGKLDPKELAKIAPSMRASLINACRVADYERIVQLSDELTGIAPQTVAVLRELIARYDYEVLVSLLSECETT